MRNCLGLLVLSACTVCFSGSAKGAFVAVRGGGNTTTYAGIPFEFTRYDPFDFTGDIVVTNLAEPQVSHLVLPQPLKAERLHVLTSLWWAHQGVEQGDIVGELKALYQDGSSDHLYLIAGFNTSEWAWDRPENVGTIPHLRAEVGFSFLTREYSAFEYEGHRYYSSFSTDPTNNIVGISLMMSDDFFTSTQWLGMGVHAVTAETKAVPEPVSVAVWAFLLLSCVGTTVWRRHATQVLSAA